MQVDGDAEPAIPPLRYSDKAEHMPDGTEIRRLEIDDNVERHLNARISKLEREVAELRAALAQSDAGVYDVRQRVADVLDAEEFNLCPALRNGIAQRLFERGLLVLAQSDAEPDPNFPDPNFDPVEAAQVDARSIEEANAQFDVSARLIEAAGIVEKCIDELILEDIKKKIRAADRSGE